MYPNIVASDYQAMKKMLHIQYFSGKLFVLVSNLFLLFVVFKCLFTSRKSKIDIGFLISFEVTPILKAFITSIYLRPMSLSYLNTRV